MRGSHGQRRVRRELAAIRTGQHPLSTRLGRPVALHPKASPRTSPYGEPKGPVCGGCAHRQNADNTPPWCLRAGEAGGTIPKWWPPCGDFRKRPRPVEPSFTPRGQR